MYEQVVSPNVNIPYVGGLCEGYVEGTVGQATLPTSKNQMTYGVYRSATQAWSNIPNKHSNEQPPKGVRVAVYFTLGNTADGHTAIHMEDGRVATSALAGYNSSGFIYPSLKDMIDDYAKHNKGCTYLGWTEYIGKIQVVRGVNMGVFTEGARKDFNVIEFGSDFGLFKEFVGLDFRDAYYKIKDTDAYRREHYINKSDLQNMLGYTPSEEQSKEFQIELGQGKDIAWKGGGIVFKQGFYKVKDTNRLQGSNGKDNSVKYKPLNQQVYVKE